MSGFSFKQLRQDAVTVIEGTFIAAIVSAEAKTNSKGNPMWKCKWQIQVGTYAGRPIYQNFNLTPESPAALKMFFGQMAVLGLGADFFDREPSEEDVAKALEGRVAEIEVGKRSWNGADQEEIKQIKPAPMGFGGAAVSQPTGGATPRSTSPSALPTALPASLPATLPAATIAEPDVVAETASDGAQQVSPPPLPF